MARFAAQEPTGTLVQELEVLVRTAVFEPANALVGHLLQAAADRIDAGYQPKPRQGRRGKQADGKAKTRQVYLGCVFTQHELDEEGHPVRDWQSTTYVSSLNSIDQFGPMLRREALRRGMGTALKVVLLIDGAEGLANMGTLCFKDAVQIVDFFHALEHAGEVLRALLGNKEHPQYQQRLHDWADRLLEAQA